MDDKLYNAPAPAPVGERRLLEALWRRQTEELSLLLTLLNKTQALEKALQKEENR